MACISTKVLSGFEREEGKNRNDLFYMIFRQDRGNAIPRNRYRFIRSLFTVFNSSSLSSIIWHGVCVHL